MPRAIVSEFKGVNSSEESCTPVCTFGAASVSCNTLQAAHVENGGIGGQEQGNHSRMMSVVKALRSPAALEPGEHKETC